MSAIASSLYRDGELLGYLEHDGQIVVAIEHDFACLPALAILSAAQIQARADASVGGREHNG
jgi:hypothetical protein